MSKPLTYEAAREGSFEKTSYTDHDNDFMIVNEETAFKEGHDAGAKYVLESEAVRVLVDTLEGVRHGEYCEHWNECYCYKKTADNALAAFEAFKKEVVTPKD